MFNEKIILNNILELPLLSYTLIKFIEIAVSVLCLCSLFKKFPLMQKVNEIDHLIPITSRKGIEIFGYFASDEFIYLHRYNLFKAREKSRNSLWVVAVDINLL